MYYLMENLIYLKDLLPKIKRHMLSYLTRFLKIGRCLFLINYLRQYRQLNDVQVLEYDTCFIALAICNHKVTQ